LAELDKKLVDDRRGMEGRERIREVAKERIKR